ncbi:MAG: preprotein translocase subunit SecY [Alphaproteobacteria bacterium]|nr:preprotein translocase subunit SecY [Alphaproteobacteria bacterium]
MAFSGENLGAFGRAKELHKRLLFVLIALLVFRLGTFIPLPGINPVVFARIFEQNQGGILGMFNMFAGGALKRMSIFALAIMPYISASIIMQLASSIVPSLMALKKEGQTGQTKINQYTRYLTVLITIVQGYGIAAGLEGMGAVLYSGPVFRFTAVVSLLGGTMFIVWLGEQITSRGIGNGSSIIITAGILAELPSAIVGLFEAGRVGEISTAKVMLVVAAMAVLVLLVVTVERAQRRISIQYPKRQIGMQMSMGDSSHLPLKINPTGVIPPIFASSILMVPIAAADFAVRAGRGPAWLEDFVTMMNRGSPLHMGLFAFLIVFFTFFYTAVVFNPTETADNLKKQGGFILGIRPGASTAEYLDYVLTRLTVLGSAYLVLLCTAPEIMASKMGVPMFLGGTTLLIVVTVIMDLTTQVQSYLIAYQYEGLLKKAHLKGRI